MNFRTCARILKGTSNLHCYFIHNLKQRVIALESSLHLVLGSAAFSGRVTLHLGFTCIQTGLKRISSDPRGSCQAL